MASVRYLTIIICVFTLNIAYLWSLPIEENDLDDSGEKNETNDDYIIVDQRQNGSENYRINIDGVIIAFSPLESLLGGTLDDFDFSSEFELNKPNEQNSTEASVPTSTSAGNTTLAATRNSGKFKRRRYSTVSGLMRTIFNQKRISNNKKE
ncbi:hypothetical protein Trydic_g10493 [Trypoxylus dichotomus]